jgi:hypothetical protein
MMIGDTTSELKRQDKLARFFLHRFGIVAGQSREHVGVLSIHSLGLIVNFYSVQQLYCTYFGDVHHPYNPPKIVSCRPRVGHPVNTHTLLCEMIIFGSGGSSNDMEFSLPTLALNNDEISPLRGGSTPAMLLLLSSLNTGTSRIRAYMPKKKTKSLIACFLSTPGNCA